MGDHSAIGDSGDIIIQTEALAITDNVRLSASTFGKGNAGNVFVQSTGLFSLSNSFVASASDAIGNGGGINIEAGSLSLTEGAQLITSTFGKGNAGNVSVRANDLVSLTGRATNIYSSVESGAVGNGGNITIKAGALSLRDGAQLQTLIPGTSDDPPLPAGRGDAGNVIIDVRDTVTLAGVNSNGDQPSGIFSANQGTGNAGNITLQANSLKLDSGAIISATTASGEGGMSDWIHEAYCYCGAKVL